MITPALRRMLLGSAVGLTLSTGLIGFAHTPAGKPLLRALMGSCPIGVPVDAATADAARLGSLSALRGGQAAAGRPALGFVLDHTTRAEVATWAAQHGVTCADHHDGLRCADVPAGAVDREGFDEVLLGFNRDGRLVSVTASLTTRDVEAAIRRWTALADAVQRQAGAPTARRGEGTPQWLARTTLGQAGQSFHYADYIAEVTATNLGQGRMSVRAVLQSPLG